MNIETIQLTNINPAEYNPRIITKDEFEGLKTSLQTFGQQENLIVNKDMTLISGHQRLQAMLALGWTDAVCNVVDLDKHEEKKLNVLMNSQAISGQWDDLKLAEILEELKLDDNYESLRLNELEPLDLSPTEVEEDEPPEVSQEPPVSKLGEIYQLGRHRVMCGDSTDKASVELLMNGVKADMVFTDPPYGVSYQSNMRTKTEKFDVIKNDDVIDGRAIEIAYEYSTGWVLVCTGWTVLAKWLEIINDEVTNLIVWDKGGGGMGDLKRSLLTDYELIMAYNRGNDIVGKRLGSVWSIGKDFAGSYAHPTQKPVELPAQAIKTFCKGSVLDLFLGSGSTLIACEQTDRTCYGMELDPKYVDVIRKRYWKFINGNEEGWEDGTTNCND